MRPSVRRPRYCTGSGPTKNTNLGLFKGLWLENGVTTRIKFGTHFTATGFYGRSPTAVAGTRAPSLATATRGGSPARTSSPSTSPRRRRVPCSGGPPRRGRPRMASSAGGRGSGTWLRGPGYEGSEEEWNMNEKRKTISKAHTRMVKS